MVINGIIIHPLAAAAETDEQFIEIADLAMGDGYTFANAGGTYREKMEFAERLVLQEAIQKAGGNKSEAAKRLGISLRTMRYKIRKYKL